MLAGLLACLAAVAVATMAEPVYVRDRLLVALREAPAADAPVVALLVSGTEVELLERRDDRARVRTADGKEGWVEVAYLTSDLPAARVIARLEQENDDLRARLARVQAPGRKSPQADAQALQRLREALASARLRNAELQARLTEAEHGRQADTPSRAGELAELRAQQQRLREELERSRARTRAQRFLADIDWRLAGAAAGLLALLAFAAGAWFVDWRYRRRHGGFRV